MMIDLQMEITSVFVLIIPSTYDTTASQILQVSEFLADEKLEIWHLLIRY